MSRRGHGWTRVVATAIGFYLTLLGASAPASARVLGTGEILCDDDSSPAPKLAVVYVNSEFVDYSEAVDGLDRLSRVAPAALGMRRSEIEFGLAFNYDEALLDKLINQLRLNVDIDVTNVLRWVNNRTVDVPDLWVDTVQNLLADYAGHEIPLLDKFVAVDTDAETHIQMYKDYYRRGRNVLLVAHGIGSLYAQRALLRLTKVEPSPAGDHIAILGVAPVSDAILGPRAAGCPAHGCYITRDDDRTVLAPGNGLPDPLPPNVQGNGDYGGLLHNNFLSAYMGDPKVREPLMKRLAEQARALGAPPSMPADPAIWATLEWRQAGDMDLHVYEANGIEHVFFDRTQGVVGNLLGDVTDGSSVEQYLAFCDDLEPGRYEFAAGYYAGERAATGHVTLYLGGQSFTERHTFLEPSGEDSVRDPYRLVQLQIDRAGPGWFTYHLSRP